MLPRTLVRWNLLAPVFALAAASALIAAPRAAEAQCAVSCSSATSDVRCGQCVLSGAQCLSSVADVRPGVFATRDGGDARSLTFARLVRGFAPSPQPGLAVNRDYNGGQGWLYYGGNLGSYCAAAGGPPRAFASDTSYTFADHRFEDAVNGLDCYNVEIDRYNPATGARVCDGETGFFDPWTGAVFDLGGEANRVAIFSYTDHPPLPCESFEYTVFLSDNPDATTVADPAHPDPQKWNPAVLSRAFLQGWIPDDPNNDSTLIDGYSMVYALPCGITFRYASLLAGNTGTPSNNCQYWSFDAELDAVAGLNEDDTAVCPDRDGDGFRDATCGGNDCNDSDPTVNPGAQEDCRDATDINCDGRATVCPSSTTCFNGLCVPSCVEGACADGFLCDVDANTGAQRCVPAACSGMTCGPDEACGPNGCQPPCQNAVCPPGQACFGGACVNACVGVQCPANQHCEAGMCRPNCSCTGCPTDQVCNQTSGLCEATGCDQLPCPAEERDCSGATARCVTDFCAGVVCPLGQVCDATMRACVADRCFGVACQNGLMCSAGQCVPMPRPDAGTDSGRADAGNGSDGGDAGAGADGGGGVGDGAVRDGAVRDGGTGGRQVGCGCRAPGGTGGTRAGWLVAVAVAGVLGRRRR